MTNPPLIVRDLRLVGGGGILGIFDLEVTRWRFVFRKCRWKTDGQREWVTLAYGGVGDFISRHDTRIFQELALDAVRELASQILDPTQQTNPP